MSKSQANGRLDIRNQFPDDLNIAVELTRFIDCSERHRSEHQDIIEKLHLLKSQSMTVPILQALLVADQIYRDQTTGKFVICGIFGTIFFHPSESAHPQSESRPPESAGTIGAAGAVGNGGSIQPGEGGFTPQTPNLSPINRLVRAGSPHAYISMTDVHGHRLFQLRYVDLNENVELFSTQFAVDCRDPLETVQISIPLPVLPVPHEGVFGLELLCDGELMGTHRIRTKIATTV